MIVKKVIEYINKNNEKVQAVVNIDSLIEAGLQVLKRDDVKKLLHVRPATPIGEV